MHLTEPTGAQQPAQAEVLVLGPADPKDLTFQKLVDMPVEYGIHIESDARDRLPMKLPKAPLHYKPVIVDADLPLMQKKDTGGRLAAYAGRGGRLIRYQRPAEFSWQDEHPLRIIHCSDPGFVIVWRWNYRTGPEG